ncbi:MAG: hypothetical protein ACRDYY_12290 [Acidimicrobiales bacterium]
MGVVASLQPDRVAVEPGQSATCELSLANTGTIVEQFTIMVIGDAGEWTRSEPPVVSLFPGGQQTVTLRFSPPRLHTTPAGEVPFGVKVIPSNEPEESVTEEGVVAVGSFNDVGAELIPRVATGRVTGRQRLAVDSRGNIPLPVAVGAIDAAEGLKFQVRPSKLITSPGEARFVRMRIKPRQHFWKGPPQQKPYKVQVAPEGEKPLVLDGALSQKALLPKWLLPLLGIIAALLLLWFLVVKPSVHSTAVNANKAALATQAAQTKNLAGKVSASQAANAANAAAIAALSHKPLPTTTTTTTITTTTAVPAPTTTTIPPPVTGPNDGQVEVVAAPGSTATGVDPPVKKGSTLTITDIVIQNVSGSAGRAEIQRVLPKNPTPQNLLVTNLATLNNQEFTFNTPIVFTHGQEMQLAVQCQGDQTACDVAVYYTGPLTQPVADTTTTLP